MGGRGWRTALAVVAIGASVGFDRAASAQAARTDFLEQRRVADPPPSILRRNEALPSRGRPTIGVSTKADRLEQAREDPFKTHAIKLSFLVDQGFSSNVFESRAAPIAGYLVSPALKLNFELGLDPDSDPFPFSFYSEASYTQFRYLNDEAKSANSDSVSAAAGVKFGNGQFSADAGYRASIDYDAYFGSHLQTRHTLLLLVGWKCNLTPEKSCADRDMGSKGLDTFFNPGFAVKRVFTDPAGSSHTLVDFRLRFTQELTERVAIEGFTAAQIRFYDSGGAANRRDTIFELGLEVKWTVTEAVALAVSGKLKHRISTLARADAMTAFASGPGLGFTLKRKF